jgi:DNA-binding NtrC family response regulator
MPSSVSPDVESILILDTEITSCITLKNILRKLGYRIVTSNCITEAELMTELERFDIVVAGETLDDQRRSTLERQMAALGRSEELILIEKTGAPPEGAENNGANHDNRHGSAEEIGSLIEAALARRRAISNRGSFQFARRGGARRSNEGQVTAPHAARTVKLIGDSQVMRHLLTVVEKVALTNSSVLITGATGTGKELIARAIHERSPRRDAPFIDINCSAIPDTLVEAELFGHQRGTFTGAHETRRGLFEEASGGTLFLDEVDALNLSAQAKLLRVLQERRVRRVGGRENIPIDVRIISATNRDLQAAVTEVSFRADLLYRLRVVPLQVPELRHRGEDIRLLIEHFLRIHGQRRGVVPRRFTAEAMRALLAYSWPGNVRELENALEYALAVCEGELLEVSDLPPDLLNSRNERGDSSPCFAGHEPLAEVERRYILAMFKKHGFHQINTAMALGIDRRTLYRKLQQYDALSEKAKAFGNGF